MQLLHDESISDVSVHRRAEALYEIADIFNVSPITLSLECENCFHSSLKPSTI